MTLNVLTTLTPVNLGSFNTTGLPNDTYTITVSVNGATGTGTLLVGTPIAASLTSTPSTALSGNQTITNTLQINSQTALPTPFTLVGQLAASGSGGVALLGNLAYVGTPTGIHVVNVANPSQPLDQSTFGAPDLGANANIQLQVYQDKLVVLASTFEGAANKLLVYSLTNPAAPTLLGQTPVTLNGSAAQDVTLALDAIANNLVFTSSRAYRYNLFTGEIFQQFGESIVIDISNPAAPTIKSVVYNQPPDPVNQPGYPDGSSNIWQAVSVNSTTELIATTTATHDVYTGSAVKGVVMVVDKSNPAAPVVLQKLEIPNMAVVTGISVQGNQAFIIGSSQYWSGAKIGLAGKIVVGLLDLTNPQAPTVISTQVTAAASSDISDITSLGNGQFVTHGLLGFDTTRPTVLMFDASDPTNIVVIPQNVPQAVNYVASQSGLLFTTDGSNLLIYSLSAEPAAIPVVASVQVPKDAGATIFPNSFNIPPTQIITGATFDTLIWNTSLSNLNSSRTFTWQTLAFLNPGEARTIVLGGTVEFASQNTPGEIELPPQFATGQQIIGISPLTQTKAPGSTFTYNVNLINPSPDNFTYETTVQGLPASWVNLQFQTPVPGNGSVTIPLTITTDAFANVGDYPFSVTVRTNSGATGFVQGNLALQGTPTQADPDAHGVVVSLTPTSATTGQGMTASYVARIFNAGSSTETFHLVASGLPTGLVATFARNDIEIPPGESNFIDIPLQVVTPTGFAATSYPFTVTATSTTTTATDSTSGSINVTGLGVRVDIAQSSALPGSTLQLVVTNTGGQTDTFDLTLGGPAGLVSTLSVPSVTLAAGASQTVTIQVGNINFAVPGGLLLSANATSRANTAIKNSDTATITINSFTGVTADFAPDTQEIPTPAQATFLLNVHNTGNVEDGYVATIVSTSGPVTASLIGLDGVPVRTISQFRLPGLTAGGILLTANLADFGTGTVTVQIRSLTNDALIAESIATVTTGEIAIEYDFGDAPASFGTTLSADGARHLPVGPYLGTTRDSETEAFVSTNAQGDDTDGRVDDEDGVTLPAMLVAGTCDCSGTGLGNQINVTASTAGYLDAWIDFNRDGDFDTNEQIASTRLLVAGTNTLSLAIPDGASAGSTYARFRISSAGGLGPTGSAEDGEVEDYSVQIFNPSQGSAGIIVDPNNPQANVLYIKGTLSSDAIVVRQTSAGIATVYIAPQVSIGSFPLASFNRIVICALAGSDSIAIESPINKPSVVYGDAGNDSIAGGIADDILFGGDGVDSLSGGNGNDIISTGPGIDTVSGGAGIDRLVEYGSGSFTLSNTQLKIEAEINTLAQLEAATLLGGDASDSFNIGGWTYPVTIDGGGGMNTLLDSGDGNFTLTPTNLTRTIGTTPRIATFSSIQNATLGNEQRRQVNLTFHWGNKWAASHGAARDFSSEVARNEKTVLTALCR